MSGWDDPYTGFFTRLAELPVGPQDPTLQLWGGVLPPWGPRAGDLALGGAGWDRDAARAACVGEGVERLQPYALPGDDVREACVAEWPLDEPPVEPERWVLFHPDQYRQPGFPYVPFTRATRCRWVCFRDAASGLARWIPAGQGFLFHGAGEESRIAPSYSTGLSCGRADDPIVLRGLQEVIERDAVVGAWWGSYRLEEWDASVVLKELDPSLPPRFLRPQLKYRYYRADSPYSRHVTLVTVEGEDREGPVFATGSACRETRAQSWAKSILEAVQGLAYVRQLRRERTTLDWVDDLFDFPHHAAYYSAHPERVKQTVLGRALSPKEDAGAREPFGDLAERLGKERPVLFRIMTPPAIAQEFGDWRVVRVVVPGLQPLHGDHRRPYLGGPLWTRPISEWAKIPPHPFA